MFKNKIKCLCFYAWWDSNTKIKQEQMSNAAKNSKFAYEMLDVEENVPLTVKYGIRNVPAIVVLRGNKVLGVETGNDGYKRINKYARGAR